MNFCHENTGLGPKIHPQNALIWDAARGEADKVAGLSSAFTPGSVIFRLV